MAHLLNFLDEIDDDSCMSILNKIKKFMHDQEIDMNDESNWPKAFLYRIKEIYRIKGIQFTMQLD